MPDVSAAQVDPADAEHPKIVAVIDIGSNSARMAIAEVHADGRLEIIERTTKAVRLGHSTFLSGRLSRQTTNAAIAILRDCRRLLDMYRPDQVQAVATSAVREADNRDAFVDRVSIATGFSVEIIEPAEESRLLVNAVREGLGESFGMGEQNTMVVEVGGGSGLLTILQDGEIAASESYNLGSIRLQEVLDTSHETPDRAADLLRHQIDNVVAAIRRTQPLFGVTRFVAVGGDARFAARQVGSPGPGESSHVVPLDAFDRLVEECSRHSVEGLARTYGLPFADAETLVPALIAYQGLVHATRAKEIVVSDATMRDGLLMDLARQARGQDDPELARSVLRAAEALGEKYRYDAAHARHVAELAVRLFDELKPEHRLGPRDRLLLQVAATLHEAGGYVSSRAHHKHSYYVIINSVVFGLRRKETELVAHIARYHRKSCPKLSHVEYMSLRREHRMVVNKLAALLRVADALDRGHAQQVRDFTIEKDPEQFVIYVKEVVDLALERRALAGKADLFQDTYGMEVRLEEDLTARAEAPQAAEA